MLGGYKIYGQGDAEGQGTGRSDRRVRAGHVHRDQGSVGVRQVDADAVRRGLDRLSAGSAWIGDVDITQLNEKQLTLHRRDKVGFIFQQFNLLPTLTAKENITFPLDLAGRTPDREWMDHVVRTSGWVTGCPQAVRALRRPAAASGVAPRPVERRRIIFADEPTGNLDSHSSAEIHSFMAAAVPGLRPDRGDGHPRSGGAAYSSRVPVPRRRPDRRRVAPPTRDTVLDAMRRIGS